MSLVNCPKIPEIELIKINNDAVVEIIFGFSALSKNSIGLRKIPPPIPTIPETNPSIEPIIRDRKVYNYYLENFTKIITADLGVEWVSSTQDTNRSTGFINDTNGTKSKVGGFTANNLRFINATLFRF